MSSEQSPWELIGPPDCPLLFRRTLLSGRLGKLLVHRFVPGASDIDPHDHPRAFVTLVLRGGYDDLTECPGCVECSGVGIEGQHCDGMGNVVERLRAPAVRYRPAEHAHVTRVHSDGALTVVVMGRLVRAWGFVRDGQWWPWRDYEREYGLNWRCP